jgi:predicted amidohydrolase YtcJ
MNPNSYSDLILHNGRITTLDPKYPEARNLAVKGGRIIGVDEAEKYQRGPDTKVIDLQGRRVIPGLNDSHLHVIRGGLNYNLELRWDGVPSLADALRMLKEQTQRTPPGPACRCNTSTTSNATTTVALMRGINSLPLPKPKEIVTQGFSAWAATASPFKQVNS